MENLKKYLLQLASEYKGEQEIEKFCAILNIKDRELQNLLRKWLCITAGSVVSGLQNDVMLLFVGKNGGEGKTHLTHWLFSLPEMQEHFIRITQNESFTNYSNIACSSFIIDFDELPASAKRYEKFIQNLCSVSFKEFSRYSSQSKSFETFKRTANIVGSTNRTKLFMEDDLVFRKKVLPIIIDKKINWQQENGYINIDLRKLWGQATFQILNPAYKATWNYPKLLKRNEQFAYEKTLEAPEKQIIKIVWNYHEYIDHKGATVTYECAIVPGKNIHDRPMRNIDIKATKIVERMQDNEHYFEVHQENNVVIRIYKPHCVYYKFNPKTDSL